MQCYMLLLLAACAVGQFPAGPPPGATPLSPGQSARLAVVSSGLMPAIRGLNVSGGERLCLTHLAGIAQILLGEDDRQRSKAVRVVDSWGKPESGVLEGNIFWLGRGSQCRGVAFNISGRTVAVHFGLLQLSIRGDPGSGGPGSGPGLGPWIGACVPESCNEEEVVGLFHLLTNNLERLLKRDLGVRVNKFMLPGDGKMDEEFIIAVSVSAVLVALVMVGTILELFLNYRAEQKLDIVDKTNPKESETRIPKTQEKEKKNPSKTEKMLLSFSLVTNVPKLLSTRTGRDNIGCLNGIRVLSMGWVIFGHTLFFLATIAPAVHVDNVAYMYAHHVNKWYFQPVLVTFCVDSFFVLSAFLLTHSLLPRLGEGRAGQARGRRRRPVLWAGAYVGRRYLRLTPSLAFVILLTVGIYKVLGNGSGPAWQPMTNTVDSCRANWWADLLYINNFLTGDVCLTWVWYLANDFQFYLVAPLFLLLLSRRPRVGLYVTSWVIALSALTSFAISYVHNLLPGPTAAMMSARGDVPYDPDPKLNFSQLYVKPYCRFGAYGVGILLGYIIYTYPTLKMRRVFYWLGWVLALGMLAGLCVCLLPLANGHFPSRLQVALYNSLARPAWAVGVSWVIFACYHREGGPINWLLSLPVWVPLSRMTYLAYLVHPLVMQYMYSVSGVKFHYTGGNYLALFVSNFVLSYAAAFVLVLLVESPILGLEKALLSR